MNSRPENTFRVYIEHWLNKKRSESAYVWFRPQDKYNDMLVKCYSKFNILSDEYIFLLKPYFCEIRSTDDLVFDDNLILVPLNEKTK